MLVNNAVIPEAKQATEFFSAPEDGPFVMVNLLKFKANAEYADGSDADLTGRQAYDRYAEGVGKLVEALGGSFEFSGEVTGILLGEVEELLPEEGVRAPVVLVRLEDEGEEVRPFSRDDG